MRVNVTYIHIIIGVVERTCVRNSWQLFNMSVDRCLFACSLKIRSGQLENGLNSDSTSIFFVENPAKKQQTE